MISTALLANGRTVLTMAELKPCPFCGSKVREAEGIRNILFYLCTNSKCGAVISFDNLAADLTPSKARENYNRRANNG